MSDAPHVVTLRAADLVPLASHPRGKRFLSNDESDDTSIEYQFKKEEVG